MKTGNSFKIDEYFNNNLEYWKSLETYCVSGCCGLDAFDFSFDEMNKSIKDYNKDEIVNSLNKLINDLESSDKQSCSSFIFNSYLKMDEMREVIKEMKNNIDGK